MTRFARRFLLVSLAVFAMSGIAIASANAPSITGYPNQISKVDLTGYTIQTSYTLGRNAGHTFVQVYNTRSTVTAHQAQPSDFCCFSTHYTAMPVGPKMVMVTWFNGGEGGDGAITDVFIFNFQTGIVSDVAPDPVNGPESLGTVKILVRGSHGIPS